MKPYYQDSYVTIYNGDCSEIVPQLGTFDLLLTDPPYGIKRDGQRASNGKHRGRKAYEFKGWDESAPDQKLFNLIFSSSKFHIIWGGNYFTKSIKPSMGWFVWDKGQRIQQSDAELAYTNMQKALRIITVNRFEIMKDVALHPTQKPVKLMQWCISQAPEAETILDPFAGSGTTGRAAKDLRKQCTLIEKEEEYCEIVAMRMQQEVLEL